MWFQHVIIVSHKNKSTDIVYYIWVDYVSGKFVFCCQVFPMKLALKSKSFWERYRSTYFDPWLLRIHYKHSFGITQCASYALLFDLHSLFPLNVKWCIKVNFRKLITQNVLAVKNRSMLSMLDFTIFSKFFWRLEIIDSCVKCLGANLTSKLFSFVCCSPSQSSDSCSLQQ